MEEDQLYNILFVVTIIAIIVILGLTFTTSTTESFTELYFEDHANLPNNIQLNKEYLFVVFMSIVSFPQKVPYVYN